MVEMKHHWSTGDPIVFRGVGYQRIWFAIPSIVVQDTPTLIAIYWRAGALGKNTYRRPVPKDLLHKEQLNLVDFTWTRTNVLMLALPRAAHSVYAMWNSDSKNIDCWYINLQAPLRRTAISFDTMDHFLDIVISPDRSEWRWKDEAEFREAKAIGALTIKEANEIQKEGERALRLLQSENSPYSTEWGKWRPPVEWKMPELRPGWDKLSEE